ncbi:hypothetical protein KAX02_08630 [candidate division WOR-3 bacterium]|nr:hypothetical protein [candidate division WOR-3 bacterium]
MEEIKDVGVGKESELEEKKDAMKEQSLAIFKQSDEAIEVADKMLRGFEMKLEDEETRPTVTGPTGVTLGAGVNYLLDSAVDSDPDRKAHKREVGATTLVEIGIGAFKTLIAGERRRRSDGKKILIKK